MSNPRIEAAGVDGFNVLHPVGTAVRYWKGAREGKGKTSRTRSVAQMLSGHTAVVWVDGEGACIPLTHVEPITEEELAANPNDARAPMPEPPHRALVGLFDPADDYIPLVFERDDLDDTDKADHWFGVADEAPYRWEDVASLAEAKGWRVVRLFRSDDPAITVNPVVAG